jgi:hypothetical protein
LEICSNNLLLAQKGIGGVKVMTTLLSVEHSLSLVMAAQNAEVEDSSTMASSCSLAQDVAILLKKVVLPDNV